MEVTIQLQFIILQQMIYSTDSYKTLSERFNSKSFLGKIMLIKQTPELFILECDNYGNFALRLDDEDAMIQGVDLWFEFPNNFSAKEYKQVFDIAGINLKTV